MFENLKIVCTICARGGSKGVKNKNLREFAGKPLIAHTISQAKETGIFDCIAVSSDSGKILEVSKSCGADVLVERDAEMATDTAPKFPVIKHCAREVEKFRGIEYDIFVDLDATAPLRLPEDIVNSVQLLVSTDAHNVITGNESRKSPYFNIVELDQNGYVFKSKQLEHPIYRRQDSPKCFDMNASIYAWKREFFYQADKVLQERTKIYTMPFERSIDIDSESEFKMAEFLMRSRS